MVVKKTISEHKVVIKENTPSEEELLMESAGDLGFNWLEMIKGLFK